MKKLAIASILLATLPAPEAQAQNMNWSGWYAGAGVGYSEVKGNWKNKQAYIHTGAPIVFPGSDQSDDMRTDGVIASLNLGYNWVVAPKWIVGAEAAWFYADQDNKSNDIPGLIPIGNSYAKFTAKDGAYLKGRIGYLVAPSTMIYGSAGAIYQRFNAKTVCPADFPVCDPIDGTQSYSSSPNKWGWTLGAGVEHAFTNRWIGRVDYSYANFGSSSFWAMVPVMGVSHGSYARIAPTSQSLVFGVNYKF